MELILVRHGETDANLADREQGGFGPPLNAGGRAQARDVARALTVDLPIHLYSSPVRRARETADAISSTHDLSYTSVDDFAEIEVGALDGLTDEEIAQRHPYFVEAWEKDAAETRVPGGETMQEVQDRAWGAIVELANAHDDGTAVVVSHYTTILAILAQALDMPLRNFSRFHLAPGAFVRIDLSPPEARVGSINETWHLGSEDNK